MGKIIYHGILRLAVLLPALWLAVDYFEYKYWWILVSLTVYGVILHPAYIQYQIWIDENKKVITNSLCSSCKHFDETAVICLKLDEHPTEEEIPCEGSAWEPK